MKKERLPRKARRALKRRKKSILHDLRKVEIKIHRIILRGDYHSPELHNRLGKYKVLNKYEHGSENQRRSSYQIFAVKQFPETKLTIHTYLDKDRQFLPKTILETSYPSKQFLAHLCLIMPDLYVVSAEYTIDLLFNNPYHVMKYFRLLRRYMYAPFQRKCITLTKGRLASKGREQNAVTRMEKVKIYERGPDEKREYYYWLVSDLDRIRIEYTAKRRDLQKLDIDSLAEFIKNPHFNSIMNNKFSFKAFRRNKYLLGEYDKYKTKDERGHKGAFQTEHIAITHINKDHKIISNLSQYLVTVKEFLPLNELIFEKIHSFEKRWKREEVFLEENLNNWRTAHSEK